MKKLFAITFVLFILSSSVFANDRQSGIEAINRCLLALKNGDEAKVLAEFAETERLAPQTREALKTFLASALTKNIGNVIVTETGNAREKTKEKNILYLFGEVKTETGKAHFTADLINENGWKLTRLRLDGTGTIGSDRFAYETIPHMTSAVDSMIAGENVVNTFMRAGQRKELSAALVCWTKEERSRAGKAEELKKLFEEKTIRFQDFIQVEEGRTNFGFGGGESVTSVRAKGKMAYNNGIFRDFSMELILEDGSLKIKRLTFLND
jgi:hypothetical protein